MAQELSGVTVVIFIACGILNLILLFIFAKRQIMRFALRSRRGPHVPIGHGAKSSFKREIEHYIDVIPRIVYEPTLLEESKFIMPPGTNPSPHYCRLKAVNDVKILEKEITKQDSNLKRHPNDNLRSFLLLVLAAPMNGCGQKLIHQFCDLYEHARHDPSEFGEEEYQIHHKLLLKLIDVAKLIKPYTNSKKSSPSKTPIKKSALSESQLCSEKKIDDEILRFPNNDNRLQNLLRLSDENETSV